LASPPRIVYVDTSALGRVLLNEPDRSPIQRALEDFDEVISSRLLWIELGRLARRKEAELAEQTQSPEFIALSEELLRGVIAIPMEGGMEEGGQGTLADAIVLPPFSVATLDAIHLATAVTMARHVHVNFMTYDKQLAFGAREHGFTVLSPR
jgi:predicted nucleic acid-binding protein